MKKISNLLMMALLTIGMGLTSCDEQLDNAVNPGVMPVVDEKGEVTSIVVDLSKIDEKFLDAGKTKLQLTVGDEVELSFTILPEEMADTKVELTADDATILSIDGLKVKALKVGETKVTAKAGDKTAECTVTVSKKAGSISYTTTEISKSVGNDAFTNELTQVGDGTVSYASDNTAVATVNATTGEVTIVGVGTANITATVADNDTYTYATTTASYTLTVAVVVESATMGSYKCAKVYTSATNGYYIMCTDHSTSGDWSTACGYSVTAGGKTFTIGSKEQWTAIMTACGGTGYNCINTKCSSVTGWSNMGTVRYWSSTLSTITAWAFTADGWGQFDPNPSFPDNFHTRLISAF